MDQNIVWTWRGWRVGCRRTTRNSIEHPAPPKKNDQFLSPAAEIRRFSLANSPKTFSLGLLRFSFVFENLGPDPPPSHFAPIHSPRNRRAMARRPARVLRVQISHSLAQTNSNNGRRGRRRRTGPGCRGIGPPPHGATVSGRHRRRGGRVASVQQLRRFFLPGTEGERT